MSASRFFTHKKYLSSYKAALKLQEELNEYLDRYKKQCYELSKLHVLGSWLDERVMKMRQVKMEDFLDEFDYNVFSNHVKEMLASYSPKSQEFIDGDGI